jgi:hypothetical protein
MTASDFSWNTLIPSMNLPPRSTILLYHSLLPQLGSKSAMVQSSHKRLKWSRGSQLDGVHVPAQFHWVPKYMGSHILKILLQLGLGTRISSYWMQSQAVRQTILSGHTDEVWCAVFSSDGRSLVSGSGDTTVKLWDMQTGGAIKTFLAILSWFALFPFQWTATIASGSFDKTVRLWNTQTGECLHTIKSTKSVHSVKFSPMTPNTSYLCPIVKSNSGTLWPPSRIYI